MPGRVTPTRPAGTTRKPARRPPSLRTPRCSRPARRRRSEPEPEAERKTWMPRYIIARTVGQLSREELDAAGRKSNEVIAGMPGVVWIRSYVSDVDGKIYCEYDAPDEEAIREHARRAGLPVDS